jgi:putative intracellular protease/amidase
MSCCISGKPTGFWLEEFAAPFYRLKEAGATLTLASPKGGQPPIDPASSADGAQTDATKRFNDDKEAQAQLASTKKLSDVKHDDFDAVFYPGGHGECCALLIPPRVQHLPDLYHWRRDLTLARIHTLYHTMLHQDRCGIWPQTAPQSR